MNGQLRNIFESGLIFMNECGGFDYKKKQFKKFFFLLLENPTVNLSV